MHGKQSERRTEVNTLSEQASNYQTSAQVVKIKSTTTKLPGENKATIGGLMVIRTSVKEPTNDRMETLLSGSNENEGTRNVDLRSEAEMVQLQHEPTMVGEDDVVHTGY